MSGPENPPDAMVPGLFAQYVTGIVAPAPKEEAVSDKCSEAYRAYESAHGFTCRTVDKTGIPALHLWSKGWDAALAAGIEKCNQTIEAMKTEGPEYGDFYIEIGTWQDARDALSSLRAGTTGGVK